MSDCSNHKKEVAGITDMKVLAEMIGDLHYESLAELMGRLATKMYKDGLMDRVNGREYLGYKLDDASNYLSNAARSIQKAWEISKPFMNS